MRSGFICRSGAIAGRMACILAAALLACASSAHSQVIEEGGFPVKAGGVWGEPFSLSCPPRLYVEAGESVLFSCSATAVPEEGVRYAWESLSGDGLRLLSNAHELSPLFTAPVSEAGAEYVYRLTAMSVGVYETATVTVVARGVSGGSVQDRGKSPVGQENCDSFGALEGFREGCVAGDKMPPSFEPFEGGFEGEEGPGLLFPEAPGLPDRPSGPVRGGGLGRQTPPYLDCPVAVFLEELEIGSIECHVSDALGEEFLEYMWEPVGSTTRDYLDNPRLIPEDSPTPSVIAPEAPRYDTLESFRSGETTFRYRYRLTATSRATGLSSFSEVEVYVSSSRPSVYCPLEVVVEEGETTQLDCKGVDPLSARMDYDEDGALIEWEWEGLWGTSTGLLDATDRSSALFTAPPGSAGEEYHYIASMTSSASGAPRTARRRVTVRVAGREEGGRNAVSVTEGASGLPLDIDCVVLDSLYEGDDDKQFRCTVTPIGGDQLLSVTWTWEDPYDPGLLSATNISDPVFYVPDNVSQTTRYDFNVTIDYQLTSGPGSNVIYVYAIVHNLEVVVACDDPGSVEEGGVDIRFSCSAQHRDGSSGLTWSWSPTTRLTGHNTGTPTFDVPGDVDGDTTWTYTVTVSAPNSDPGEETVKVKVRDTDGLAPSVRCTNAKVYEGAGGIMLSCSVVNEPTGATYAWAGTDIANRLTGTGGLTPTFKPPDEVGGADKDYEYTVTLSASGIDDVAEDVTVTVLEKPDITWCGVNYSSDYSTVWEGVGSKAPSYTCVLRGDIYPPQGAPSGSVYAYAWSTRGDTPASALDLLTNRNRNATEFRIPAYGTVDEDQTYEYRLTISAANADDANWDWTVLVKNSEVTVTCDDPDDVHEGDMDIDFSCSAAGPPGSTYTWLWFPTTRLTGHDTGTPTFDVPDDVDQDTTYTYTVTASAANADDGNANVTVTVKDLVPAIACNAAEAYEGAYGITLECLATNEPTGATYAWAGTDIANRLTGTGSLTPTFTPPGEVGGANKDYDYTVTMMSGGSEVASADVTVTVKEKPDIYCPAPTVAFALYAGGPDEPLLVCEDGWKGAPVGSDYAYVWTARGTTANTDLLGVTGMETPMFDIPDAVESVERYYYTLTVSAANADDASVEVEVSVWPAPSIACTDPDPVYEGSGALTLSCSAENEPTGATYGWAGRDAANRLTGTGGLTPTFTPPRNVDANTDYDYTVTMTSGGSEVASAGVTVTVWNKRTLSVVCPHRQVYEGAPDFTLSCRAVGAPAGSVYAYSWVPRQIGGLSLLSDRSSPTPTFYVPDEVDRTTTYEYWLTASADNAEDGFAYVRITVRNKPQIAITCPGDPYGAYEGSAPFALDCSASGAPAGSVYSYVWSARGDTPDLSLLTGTSGPAPTFSVPSSVSRNETYYYTLTVSAQNAEAATADVTVTVLNKRALSVACTSPPLAYEGSAPFDLNCSASGAPVGSVYAYAWTPRGSTTDTSLLTDTNSPTPTFSVPSNIDADETYEYRVTVSAQNADDATADVTVTVLNKKALSVVCVDLVPEAYEGSASFALDCSASGAPVGSVYAYAWTPRGSTTDTSLLTDTNSPAPTFSVPSNVDADETYEYRLTVSAANADDATADVTVTVLNKKALSVVCVDLFPEAYEGSASFALDCSASGAPVGSVYAYAWTPRGSTTDTSLLTDTNSPAPTFSVPSNVDADETYEYRLTVSAANADDATADVTVTVLDKRALSVACADPGSVYEGSAAFDLDCVASGAPVGSVYSYVWSARGDASDLSLLTGTSGPAPTFSVPLSVNSHETYEYTLTVSAANAEDATADVTVTVLDKGALSVACASPPLVYEGSAPFDLNCSASGAPGANPVYSYVWSARGDTPDLSLLTGTSSPAPTFSVPSSVNGNETYEYTLTVSAANAEDATADVTVTVLDKGALSVACASPPLAYEGSADFALDCAASGAPGANPVYSYVWSARGDTPDLSLLTGTSSPAPTFSVPLSVNGNETYEYRLTVSAANAEDATADVTVTVLNKHALSVACASPPLVYEGSAPFDLNCAASGAPGANPVYSYVWSARGDTPDLSLLTGTSGPMPTFSVPSSVNGNETYEYTLTVSAANAEDATADVTVTVLDKGALSVACAPPPLVYEGSAPFDLDCSASGAPGANPVYSYVWSARGDTPDLSLLTGTSGPMPTFSVPSSVNGNETYEYTLTVSAANAEDATADVTVTVLDKGALSVACASPPLAYEGSAPFALDCAASGAPGANPVYSYVWSARGDTPDTALLSAADIASPTFYVPDEVDGTTAYEYLLTASAENAESGSAAVTVTVLNAGALHAVCTDPPPVYEGSEDFDLDCTASGAPAGSEYAYVWTARGTTANTDLLSAMDISSPTFYVPDEVDETTLHEYLLTVSAENAEDGSAEVTVTVLKQGALHAVCADPPPVYEGSEDFDLDCSASGAPAGSDYEYAWTARGDTPDTALLIAGTDGPTPTFDVPDALDRATTYEYLLTVSAENAEDASAEVTVTVLNKDALAVACADPPLVYEGSEDFAFDCSASGAPAGSDYEYAWTARGDTPDTALLIAGTDGPTPTFDVPDALDRATTYEYLLTASAENAEDASAEVTVTVLNKDALAVACADPPLVYEGSADFALDCTASGAQSGSDYTYVWTARGTTANTDLLSAMDIDSPTFYVPDEVDGDETYEYLLTVSAENAEDASAEVTVTVLNKDALAVACAYPPLVYEGSEDFAFDCSASGTPAGSDYEYAWTARGTTANTDLLSAMDIDSPTFYVPDEVDGDETYEYLLTVSAENAEDAEAEVTVTVLNKDALAVACADPPLVYEGSEDFAFDCSASGAPAGSDYEYAWTARGDTPDTALLIAGTDGPTPTFDVPDALDRATTYEYLLTASAENAEDASAEVTVTVLNKDALAVACADPPLVYEGSADFALDCTASGAQSGSDYTYVWTARGTTANTDLLSAMDIDSPTFYVPDEVDGDETYEYLLTVSAENAEDAEAEVTVTVLNKPDILLACADPGSVYEGSEDITFDCSASGAPGDSPRYTYVWTARGDTQDTSLLSAADIESPTFYVPDEVDGDETYEYLLTASAENAEDASAQVTVTVLDKPVLAVACAGPYSLYEGSEDFALDCSASGAPEDSPRYTYVWTARGDTQDTSLLSATDVATPTFLVPDDLPETTTYEYLLTASAANAKDASAGVSVTVMHPAPLAFVDDSIANRVYIFTVDETIEDIALPDAKGGFPPYAYTLSPALPPGLAFDDQARTISGTPSEVRPRREYAWQASDANGDTAQIAFFIEVAPAEEPTSPPVAGSSSELPGPSALGVTVSASSLRFGVQSADTEVSLDPMTDGISTYVSGPYHGGRMTLAPGGGEALDENGEMVLSIELASPVVLKRADAIEESLLVLTPVWSLSESCEQLSSQAVGGLYTEVTLSEDACRLLRFGGELDLTDAASGRYAGSMDLILRSGESEEAHSVEVDVTVVPAQQIITIGPRGVRFGTSRELSAGLTEEQNLSIYPHVAFLTESKPHGVFELSNPSLIPLEISVSARFGYTEATEDGREVVAEDASDSRLGDLSEVVDIYPGVLVLMPGEKGLVRYGVQEGTLASMSEQGYAAFFDVVSAPRQYVRTDRMPEEVTGDRTARVTMRVPGVYVPGEGASQLRARLLSVSYAGPMSATFLLETQDRPFAGEVVAYDGQGRELGRRETLVYTRSRVRVPLDRMPEEGTVFLRFAPRRPGRAPEPASVDWNAPLRDIGDAGNKDRTSVPATLVRKP